jgi:hypothetical protein
MLKFILVVLMFFPMITHASLTRVIDEQTYSLHDDFDTADGECVLRGYEYASFFYSMGTSASYPVVKLSTEGRIIEVIENPSPTVSIIEGLGCQ